MSHRTILLVLATLAVVIGLAAYSLATQEPGPLVTITGPVAVGGQAVDLDVSVDPHGSRLSRLEAWLEQGGRRFPLFDLASGAAAQVRQETPERLRLTYRVPTAALGGLKDGTGRIVVLAERPLLFGFRHARTEAARDVAVHVTPPALAVLSTHHYVRLGGAEMVVYRVTPPEAVSGVTVGDRFYRGYPASGVIGARGAAPGVHVAFFALAFDQDLRAPIRLTARDAAGNTAEADFEHRAFPSTFSATTMVIDDRLLARIVPPIVAATPGLSLAAGTPDERLQAFLHINSEVRRQNTERLAALAAETSPEWLGRDAFRRLAGAKSEAPFAEHRTYVHQGRNVDEQVHLGFDLASTRGAAVAASNTGRVVFAAYLGIYGNCVVLDHGMGVQTLYGHLSVMDVEAGDRVERGESIGRSGATGLAGGDHVHFTVLVGGTPVNPIEWWDPHWMHDRVERKLREAGIR